MQAGGQRAEVAGGQAGLQALSPDSSFSRVLPPPAPVPACWAGLREAALLRGRVSRCGFCLPRATSKVRLPTAGALGFLGVTAPEAPLVAALRAWGQAMAWLLLPKSPQPKHARPVFKCESLGGPLSSASCSWG